MFELNGILVAKDVPPAVDIPDEVYLNRLKKSIGSQHDEVARLAKRPVSIVRPKSGPHRLMARQTA